MAMRPELSARFERNGVCREDVRHDQAVEILGDLLAPDPDDDLEMDLFNELVNAVVYERPDLLYLHPLVQVLVDAWLARVRSHHAAWCETWRELFDR